MFTGIIEEKGRIRGLRAQGQGTRITIEARSVLEEMRVGDSIAVSGPCLTVVALAGDSFTADLSPETLRATTLADLRPGDAVNLERALQAGGRLGGHFVSGHVDGIGILKGSVMEGNAFVLTFSAPKEVLRISVPKGSIAVDGVSLTLNQVQEESFSVSIIPHTAEMTTLGALRAGDRVNLESDLIGKYIERILSRREGRTGLVDKGIDMGFLAEHGFV